MRMSPHSMMPGDSDSVKDVRLAEGTFRRVWQFAKPYRTTIIVFLGAIVASALLALVPPFVIRAIIDDAIPDAIADGNRRPIAILAALAVAAALADAGLAILQRWCSARVGEGLIFDLRSTLFAKVQRLPIAFFTRTPTGSITSRLNNDVIGAQSAVTSTLGSVVSNVIVLVTTLSAMIFLEWRLTLLTLIVLPLFVVPARRVGMRLQGIAREQMGHNAAMNTQMTERFNVSGAMLVKLFGSGDRERSSFDRRAAGVRDTGIRAAIVGRVFFVALGLVAAIGTAAIYGIGAVMVVDGTIETGTLVALAALVTRVYQPLTGLTNARVDLMTSMVSFERVFEVLDAPEAIREKPGAVDLVDATGTIEFDDVVFRYPAADATAIASMEQNAGLGGDSDPDVDVLRGLRLSVAAGETGARGGASGGGKATT
ncbi:MAG: ABC transporter ATP-binding protein, partial [Ilumatobacter sp.]